MKSAFLIGALLFTAKLDAQVTIIATNTNEQIRSIHKQGSSFVIGGVGTFLSKCSGGCYSLVPLTIPYSPQYPYFYFNLSRPDSNTLYMTAIDGFRHLLWSSGNCGSTWSKKFDTLYYPDIQVPVFFDSLNGVNFCGNFKTIRSGNGFSTFSLSSWTGKEPSFGTTDGDSTVVIVGGPMDGEGLSISYDRGASWFPGFQISGLMGPINDVKFKNSDTLFAITRHSSNNYDSAFAMSFNKGAVWKNMKFGPNYPVTNPLRHVLRRLHVKAVNEIYVLAHDNQNNEAVIFKTLNQGISWYKYVLPFSTPLNDIAFINDSVALVCGNSGLLFKWNRNQAVPVFVSIQENAVVDNLIEIYPIPAKDEVRIKINTKKNSNTPVKLSLFDVFGKKLKALEIKSNSEEFNLDLSELFPGIYFLRVEGFESLKPLKVVKE